MPARELNLDGLVGPTHNYAGLSFGNVASQSHRHLTSNPKAAALQGLAKMKALMDLGVPQAVLPPQERPDFKALRAVGFDEPDPAALLLRVARDAPQMLAVVSSASSMWAANAATVSPSADTADNRVHFTPANLVSHLHRSLEREATAHALRTIFPDETHFTHHGPLTPTDALSDEGAANHTRFCAAHDQTGVQWFVFGRGSDAEDSPAPAKYPARQTLDASTTIASRHGLDPTRTLFTRQHPDAIDAGVFHNDVIAVGHGDVLLIHECALVNQPKALDDLRRMFHATTGSDLSVIEVSQNDLSIEDAVATYLFNSQLVTTRDDSMVLICPTEAREHEAATHVLDAIVSSDDNPISQIIPVDTRQSMANGGGPACLRLRVALTDNELAGMKQSVVLNDSLYDKLVAWVNKHYRDALAPDDLADERLVNESRRALDVLSSILDLGDAFYPFQRGRG